MGEWMYRTFLDLTIVRGECSASRPGCCVPEESVHGTNWNGRKMGPRADLYDMEKLNSRPYRDSVRRSLGRLAQWFPNLWYVYPWGYAKIILVIAENKKKILVKIKTQKQSYEVLSLDPPTTSHIIILMLFLFVLNLCQAYIIKKIEINCEM
jgi:hypothetical protein